MVHFGYGLTSCIWWQSQKVYAVYQITQNSIPEPVYQLQVNIVAVRSVQKTGIDMQGLGAPEILQNFRSHLSCLELVRLVAHGTIVPEYSYANLSIAVKQRRWINGRLRWCYSGWICHTNSIL